MGSLAANRHTASVTDSLVAANLDLAPDVRSNLTAQIAFYFEVDVNPVTKGNQLFIAQLLGPQVGLTPVASSAFAAWERPMP